MKEPLAAEQAITTFAAQMHEASANAESALAELRRAGTLSPWLPLSLALSFFAALAVAVGHFVYQARAPAIVRQHSEIDHVRERREAFRDQYYADEFAAALMRMRLNVFDRYSNSNGRTAAYDDNLKDSTYQTQYFDLRAEWSDNFKGMAAGEEEAERIKLRYGGITPILSHIYWFDMMTMEQEISRLIPAEGIPWNTRKIMETFYENIFGHSYIGPIPEEMIAAKKLDVIGEAARMTYVEASRERRGFISLTFLAYGLGFTLLLWILVKQCLAVLAAAGWVST